MYLLDTNVVSEMRKVSSGRANSNVAAWSETVDPSRTFLSAIVLHELEVGVRGLERTDVTAGKALRRWLDDVVKPAYANRILPVNNDVAIKAAEWHVPDPRPINDAYIAATANVHRLTLVTRNLKDFARMDVALLNPWDPPQSPEA